MGDTIFWFRRDLRFEDNLGLYKALSSSNCVIPIFIFDKNIIDELDKDDPRITLIFDRLIYLNKKIKEFNIGHFLIGESIFEGLEKTIKKFKFPDGMKLTVDVDPINFN